MDVESKQTLEDAVAKSQQAGDEIVDRVSTRLTAIGGTVIDRAQKAADEVIDRAMAKVDRTIASLDGWTVTITVPPIVIRLSGPK